MLNKTNTAMSDERFAEYCDYIAANRPQIRRLLLVNFFIVTVVN